MCLRIDLTLDSESDEVDHELEYRRGLLARIADALGIPESSSCNEKPSSEEPSPSPPSTEIPHHIQNQPPLVDSHEIHVELGHDVDKDIVITPVQKSVSVDYCNAINNLFKTMRDTLKKMAEKPELVRDEFLLTLVGVIGQNAMQISSSSSSTCCNVAMVSNYIAFILLLSGVLMRPKPGKGHQWVRNMLVLVGILLAVAGPVLSMSRNIPGLGGYLVPVIACLLPFIGVFF